MSIKALVVDSGVLGSREPRSIRLYLRTHGWQRDQSNPLAWSYTIGDERFEVTAPSSAAVRDYPRRVAELVATLAVVEERSELEIVRDLGMALSDVHYLRLLVQAPAGEAPISRAVSAYQGIESLVSAVAESLVQPRRVHLFRKAPQTTDLMSKVRVAAPLEGSYVVPVVVPVPPVESPEEDMVLFDAKGEPFERRVSVGLLAALRATLEASAITLREPDVGIEPFEQRLADGISANVCEAIAAIAGDGDCDFEVWSTWALDRPLPATEPLRVDRLIIPVLMEAAIALRELSEPDPVTVIGNVVRLYRDQAAGPGEVSIAGVIVGDVAEKLRRFTIDLSEIDYSLAIALHGRGGIVAVTGVIEQKSNRYRLREVSSFVETSI